LQIHESFLHRMRIGDIARRRMRTDDRAQHRHLFEAV
jgi:hypothetical protein